MIMISFRSQDCATADRIVSAIHFSALCAGMRIDTNGFIFISLLTVACRLLGLCRRRCPTNALH